ncbi:hypothetical protein ACO0QE_003395 [Hanseniaspora vineae]
MNESIIQAIERFGVDCSSLKKPILTTTTFELYAVPEVHAGQQVYVKVETIPSILLNGNNAKPSTNPAELNPEHPKCASLIKKMTNYLNYGICKQENIVRKEILDNLEITLYCLDLQAANHQQQSCSSDDLEHVMGQSRTSSNLGECPDYFYTSNDSASIISEKSHRSSNLKNIDAGDQTNKEVHVQWVERKTGTYLEDAEALREKKGSNCRKKSKIRKSIGHIVCKNSALPKSPMPFLIKECTQDTASHFNSPKESSLRVAFRNTHYDELLKATSYKKSSNTSLNSLLYDTFKDIDEYDDEYLDSNVDSEDSEEEFDSELDTETERDDFSDNDDDDDDDDDLEDDDNEHTGFARTTKICLSNASEKAFELPKRVPTTTIFQLGSNGPHSDNSNIEMEMSVKSPIHHIFPRTPVPPSCESATIQEETQENKKGSWAPVSLNLNQSSVLNRRKHKSISV